MKALIPCLLIRFGGLCQFIGIFSRESLGEIGVLLRIPENETRILSIGVISCVAGLMALLCLIMAGFGERIKDLERRARTAEEQLGRIQGIS